MSDFYLGTSNVALPVPNKSYFPAEYQDKSRLAYYASVFNSIEINASFKTIPLARTVQRWTSEVPSGFRFTFKLFRGITHAKELAYDVADIYAFLDVVNVVGDKKGCLLIQFPASIKIACLPKLQDLLKDIMHSRKADDWKLAIEFRDPSWYQQPVYDLLRKYGAAVVIHDMPKSAPPIEIDTGFLYLRFHGENGRYRGSYSEEFLAQYAKLIVEWQVRQKPVFAYFNNTLGAAASNALTLHDLGSNFGRKGSW